MSFLDEGLVDRHEKEVRRQGALRGIGVMRLALALGVRLGARRNHYWHANRTGSSRRDNVGGAHLWRPEERDGETAGMSLRKEGIELGDIGTFELVNSGLEMGETADELRANDISVC